MPWPAGCDLTSTTSGLGFRVWGFGFVGLGNLKTEMKSKKQVENKMDATVEGLRLKNEGMEVRVTVGYLNPKLYIYITHESNFHSIFHYPNLTLT